MITVFHIPFVNTVCPNNMTETKCPLRKYMKTQSVLQNTINESVFELTKPYAEIRDEYITTLDRMHNICNLCKSNNR